MTVPKHALPLLLAVVGLVGAAAIFSQQAHHASRLQSQLSLSQQQLVDMTSRNQELTQQLDTVRAERGSLDERVSALRDQLASAKDELEQTKRGLAEVQERSSELGASQQELELQVKTLTGERDQASGRAKELEQTNAELERSVGRLRERLALLNRDYRQVAAKLNQLQAIPPSLAGEAGPQPVSTAGLRMVASTGPSPSAEPPLGSVALTSVAPGATVELPPIIVRKDQAGMSMPVRGRVVEVNAGHNFVVVDQGSMDGVRVGMTFNLVRGSSTVGQASVVRVRPRLSACDIARTKTPGPLQPGDLAIQAGL